MQLGARWRAGEPPHRSVPASLHPLIFVQEEAHPQARDWTLTWLEGRPRCALDEIVTIGVDATGIASVLPGSQGSGRTIDPDDDDDEWLN